MTKNVYQSLCTGFLGLLLMLVHLSALAQPGNRTVSGTVTDEKGDGLPGVSIVLKGIGTPDQMRGTTSDANGQFKIQVPNQNATLTVSFVGYASQQITVGNRSTVDVQLAADNKSLDEVVVVGYGTQKKSDLTGSVSSLRSESIKEIPATSLEQAMQGRLAGVQIQQSSGQPGAGVSIRVRGVTSIAGGNEPLIVIDGLPQVNSDVRSSNVLATINPQDIESIEVLKDASSTAIYGSRGANGVVIITTKSGKSGVTRISYDTYVGVQQVRKRLDLMNGSEFLAYTNQLLTNSKQPITAEVTNAKNANTDWQNELFRSAVQQNHNLSLAGGSDRVQYFVSGNYLKQDGVVRGTNYTRGGLRFNLNASLSKRFSVATRFTASRSVQNGASPPDGTNTQNFGKSVIGSIVIAPPTVAPINPDGSYGNVRPYSFSGLDVENPLAFANEAIDRRTITRFQGGIDLKFQPIQGLTNTFRLGFDNLERRTDAYLSRLLPQVSSGAGIGRLGLLNSFNVLAEDFLEYKRELTPGLVAEAIVGASFQTERQDITNLEASGYLSDDLKNYNFAAATNVNKPQTDIIRNTIISAFGRVRVNYKERYLLSASLRRDGSSVFSKNNKYANFPSVGAGWNISQEEFLKTNRYLSNLKLRASWGQSGNQAIQPYQSLSLGNTVNTGQGAGTGLSVGLSPTLPNDNLTWETTTQTNFGLDLGFLNDRYRGSIDYYVKTTGSLLATVQLPPSAGYNTIVDNVGEVQNKGVELVLGATLINTADWRLNVDANVSWNQNRVTKTKDNRDLQSGGSNDASQTLSIIRVGEPLSSFYGPKFSGFDDKGKQTWVDQNNDGKITSADFVTLGSPYPTMIYGLITSLSYKKVTFLMTWQGVEGAKVNNVGLYALTTPVLGFNRLRSAPDYFPVPATSDVLNRSDLFIEDASYLRLKNIRLDYRLPTGRVLKNASVYVSGQNLLTYTKYSGFDPEVNAFSGNDVRQGVDLGSYPAVKAYTLGLSVSF
ncbi:MAG: TonB-dependent receptor [Spirosoma sp.]|nr:TonB-dependent receptor [Spirosoma sp.]